MSEQSALPDDDPAVPAEPSAVPDDASALEEDVPVAPPSRRVTTGAIAGIVTLLGVCALAVLPAPYLVNSPGQTFDTLGSIKGIPLITVSGAKTYPTTGELRLTTVSSAGGPGYAVDLVHVVKGWLSAESVVEPRFAFYEPDETPAEAAAASALQMTTSQENATVAALEELGYEVPAVLTVYEPVEGSGAVGVLAKGDVVTSLDGKQIRTYSQLTTTLRALTPGATVRVGFTRAGAKKEADVVTGAKDGHALLGIYVEPTFDLPVDVKIQIENVGGPSAGTMFALGVIDKLTPQDEAKGAHIAGTGTIDVDGTVGPIGGIRQKLAGALHDGATWFLAPAANCSEVVGHVPDGLSVTAVATLAQARDAVVAIGAGKTSSLPTCEQVAAG